MRAIFNRFKESFLPQNKKTHLPERLNTFQSLELYIKYAEKKFQKLLKGQENVAPISDEFKARLKKVSDEVYYGDSNGALSKNERIRPLVARFEVEQIINIARQGNMKAQAALYLFEKAVEKYESKTEVMLTANELMDLVHFINKRVQTSSKTQYPESSRDEIKALDIANLQPDSLKSQITDSGKAYEEDNIEKPQTTCHTSKNRGLQH
jgi:hypothetical protein